MIDENGNVVLIDPSTYYGHREMDLAMTLLFGGFDPRFYETYNDCFPLEIGWEERIHFCNLYPLLVHLNLFGRTYLSSIKQIIKKF
jgi:fructosamine-3-kinase